MKVEPASKIGKQVAQQDAERAKYEVEQAKEAKKSTIIKAEASAKSIELVGQASMNNPCTLFINSAYLDVRRIEYTEKIAQILADTKNHVLLNNEILNMSLPKMTTKAEKVAWSCPIDYKQIYYLIIVISIYHVDRKYFQFWKRRIVSGGMTALINLNLPMLYLLMRERSQNVQENDDLI